MKSAHRLSKSSITEEELKRFAASSNVTLSDDEDDEDDEDDDDNHSSVAGGDIASAIDDNQTNGDQTSIESSIVLKQVRRLSSAEPALPPAQPTVTITEDNEKPVESDK